MCLDLYMGIVKGFEAEFKQFMGITDFPAYQLTTKEVSLSLSDSQGYGCPASAFYEPKIDRHTLQISTNLMLLKYIAFHEFTHILDSEMYAKGNSIAYVSLSGYTEYHASQIELLQLLGAKSVNEKISFSVNAIISTFSDKTSVIEYLRRKQNLAIELFSRDGFPGSIETLHTAFGVLFNYWGLRSICELYASDYVEEVQNEAFLHYISTENFCLLNTIMHGWLEKSAIDKSLILYSNSIIPLLPTNK